MIEKNVAIFGSFGKRLLAPGWKKETAFAALGGGEFDLSDAPPATMPDNRHRHLRRGQDSSGARHKGRQAEIQRVS